VKLVVSRRPVGKVGETQGVFPGLSIGGRACAVRRAPAQPAVYKFTVPLRHRVTLPPPQPARWCRNMLRPVFASRAPDADAADCTIRFRDIDSLDRLRAVIPRQQVRSQACQLFRQTRLHPLLVYSVNARRIGAPRRQHDPGDFSKPRPISNEPEKTIEPAGPIALCPCRELVLHFTDYQRSSPHLVRSFALQAG
jgi:hypothetical protein